MGRDHEHFALSLAASLCGATSFAWNGFFTARMLSGHLFFHSRMLVPLAAWWSTRPLGEGRRGRRLTFDFYGVQIDGNGDETLVALANRSGGEFAHIAE